MGDTTTAGACPDCARTDCGVYLWDADRADELHAEEITACRLLMRGRLDAALAEVAALRRQLDEACKVRTAIVRVAVEAPASADPREASIEFAVDTGIVTAKARLPGYPVDLGGSGLDLDPGPVSFAVSVRSPR